MSLKTIFCLKCLAGALFTVVFAVAALVFPWAKLTVQVRDETGTPLSGAYVRLGFEMPNIHEMGTIFSRVEGKTDSNGLYDGAAECATGHVTAYATKAGYYTSSGVSVDLVRGTTDTYWSPWNATQLIVLKKIIDPVPMYARKRCVILLPAESGFVRCAKILDHAIRK